MDEKRKLSPKEEQKIENILKNLMTRVYAIYREDRTGSIETRKSYFGADGKASSREVEPCMVEVGD